MERQALLDAVETVAPALATSDLIPALKYVWFLGEQVMAYNDAIAISVPLHSEFVGALPGNMLIELLRTLITTEQVELKSGDGHAVLKTVRDPHVKAQSKLPMLGREAFLFKMPSLHNSNGLAQTDEFFPAVENCLRSVAEYSPQSDQLGITLNNNGDTIELYSTDKATLSHSYINDVERSTPASSIILSAQFCEQMLKLGKDVPQRKLLLRPDHSLFAAGGRSLFGRLLIPSGQIDFPAIINYHLPNNFESKLVKIPEQFSGIINRAGVYANIQGHDIATTVRCQGGHMRFETKSERGEQVDQVALREHPDVEVKLLPRLLQRGLDKFTHMLITKDCAIMANGNNFYMVSKTEG